MIDFLTILKIALKALWVNKMRSVLTSLGIIIGVAAVIVMLSVGNGAQISIVTGLPGSRRMPFLQRPLMRREIIPVRRLKITVNVFTVRLL